MYMFSQYVVLEVAKIFLYSENQINRERISLTFKNSFYKYKLQSCIFLN
jgi:hypothetical protein